MLSRRVRDGVLLRLIGKWLKAGVMEEGCVYHPETGTPQGGVVSPLLANIFLHEVVDMWFQHQVKPRLGGRALLVRYADDIVILFEREDDARRVYEVLPKRFGKYGLRLHPEKTRLVSFRRPSHVSTPQGRERGRSGTFDLLGFTHFWGRSRKGSRVVKRKTMSSRFSRTMRRFSEWCRVHRHLPMRQQHAALNAKLRGHDAYYGITGNYAALALLRFNVERVWHKWLSRRSRTARIPWTTMQRLLRDLFPLARPRVVHSVLSAVAKP